MEPYHPGMPAVRRGQMESLPLRCGFFSPKIYLFIYVRERERLRPICWFTPQRPLIAWAGQSQSQAAGTPPVFHGSGRNPYLGRDLLPKLELEAEAGFDPRHPKWWHHPVGYDSAPRCFNLADFNQQVFTIDLPCNRLTLNRLRRHSPCSEHLDWLG